MLPVPAMRLLSLLLLLGLCCLWARLVSTGEHRVGMGTRWGGAAGGCTAQGGHRDTVGQSCRRMHGRM